MTTFFLDIKVGEELIVPDEIGFEEPEFVCEPGSVIRGKTCGRFIFVNEMM